MQVAFCHLMSRGDRREEIFRDDLDRKDFLKTLGAACQKALDHSFKIALLRVCLGHVAPSSLHALRLTALYD
jgi:hypothetical protein